MKDFRIGSGRPVLAKRLDRYLSFPVMVRLDDERALVAYRDAESAPGTRTTSGMLMAGSYISIF